MSETDETLPWAKPPAELFYFCLVAPLLYAPVLQRDFFEMTRGEMAMALVENCSAFIAIPGLLYVVYRWAVPRVRPLRGVLARTAFHALVGAAVAAPTALAIRPLMELAHPGEGPPAAGIAAACVVITWTLLVPALVVQELRTARQGTQQAALRAQLEALKSRTMPHFLFNALNTVASLIPEQPALAENIVERMAGIFRYTLRSARLEEVALREELAMIEDYLEVQRARFGSRLTWHIDVEPGLELARLPPLMLQPLVENAVLHGVAPRVEGGTVRVVARAVDGRLALRVDDEASVARPADAKHRSGTGTSLRDLYERLALTYGAAGSLELTPNGQGGYTAALSLPWSGA
ncbi:MAG: histidine kinase [Archangiaceae bacterium]|nr:histidine kinase [Archangiaceae bacterium]